MSALNTDYFSRCIQTLEQAERWLRYRDNRNATAHDYGVDFAEQTLVLLPHFIADAKRLHHLIQSKI